MRTTRRFTLCLALMGMALFSCSPAGMRKRVGPAPALVASTDDAVISRGAYLAKHIARCLDCHSERNYEIWGGPVAAGSEGRGGQIWDRDDGFPGTMPAPNITPTGVGTWTDGELMHGIVTGLHRNGHAMFPIMPYRSYGVLTTDDAKAIVAWMRTLAPIEAEPVPRVIAFPMNKIVNRIPQAANPTVFSDSPTRLERGIYLAKIAGCEGCHTPTKGGRSDAERAFGGGREFPMRNGVAISPNITMSEGHGIGYWDEAQFLGAFQRFRSAEERAREASPSDPNTTMPWVSYAGMTDDDLKAIWTFIQTVPVLESPIEETWRAY